MGSLLAAGEAAGRSDSTSAPNPSPSAKPVSNRPRRCVCGGSALPARALRKEEFRLVGIAQALRREGAGP